jgi:divalent metal cation (Fe/Co/Zn/Cd) transporter
VVAGAAGVWLGFPLADPLVGLLISLAIGILLWGTARDIGRRLMDGVDPALLDRAEHALKALAPGATLRMRWMGHKLHLEVATEHSPTATVAEASADGQRIEAGLRRAVPNVGSVVVTVRPPAVS